MTTFRGNVSEIKYPSKKYIRYQEKNLNMNWDSKPRPPVFQPDTLPIALSWFN